MPSIRLLIPALAALLLSGCASVILVDNQVESFPRWQDRPANAAVPAAPQVYRFERLPSQQQEQRGGRGQEELERYAEASLAKLGWTRAAANVPAPWAVQVGANNVRLPRAPWEDPWDYGWGPFGHPFAMPGRDYVVTGSGQVVFFPMMAPRFETPYYQRTVSLVIRDAASGRVVYETRAAHDGRWNSTPELWTAMLDAALQGFPAPPTGVRQVNIEVPR
jgi:hypothetical protein